METLQPSVGGLPPAPNILERSFKDVVLPQASAQTPNIHVQASTAPPLPYHPPTAPHRSGTHKGTPAIYFPPSHITQITQPFHWSLIGKFSQGYNKTNPTLGRPSVEDLATYFQALDLKQEVQLGLLDNRHVLIQPRHHEDFLRIYSRPVWYVKGMPMRIFKWTSAFHVDRESPISPVWITLPRLPVHFFEPQTLMAISALIGTPLRLDASTRTLKRPSMARVQVEIDLLKPRLEKLWIGVEQGEGFWQKIEYEDVPDYCQHCWHVGHSEQQCTVHNPELRTLDARPTAPGVKPPDKKRKQIYVPKKPTEPAGPSPIVTVLTDPSGSTQPPPMLPNPKVAPLPIVLPTTDIPQAETPPYAETTLIQQDLAEEVPALNNSPTPADLPDTHISDGESDSIEEIEAEPPMALLHTHSSTTLLPPAPHANAIPDSVLTMTAGLLCLPVKSLDFPDTTREELLADFRKFNLTLQELSFSPPESLPLNEPVLPHTHRKRGRPPKDFFAPPRQAPPHPMVTRSATIPPSQ